MTFRFLGYEVNPEAIEFFSALHGKVSIISVAGIYRTGKSFLLNKMILNQTKGFAVGPTTNAKTKGIWVWGKPLTCHTQNDEIVNVIVLDSEGLGSTEEDINHDLRLFSITLLMSSAFLYNTVGSVDQNALDSLGLVLRLCEHLKTESYNDFPDFYWILRDFSLALVDKDGQPITTKQYLENCLQAQPGDSEIRNRIRASIKQSFQTRRCVTFVRPLTDESSLQKLDNMDLDELRPEFVQEVIDFRKLIFQSIKIKTIKGKEVKGEMLTDLINLYVAEINGDSLPVIETGWKYVCQKECENVVEEIETSLSDSIQKDLYKLPETKAEFIEKRDKIVNRLLDLFKERTKNNDHSQEFYEEVKENIERKMKKIEGEMKVKNVQETKNFIRKEFESVEKKLKQSDFKNMGELVKEFEVFYEYYRKKCPYKDEVQVGLEYLLKKFSDCALIVFKGMKNKKDSQISSLKQEVERLSSELSSKEEKYKQQRQSTKDRIAIFESTIANLQNINRQNNEVISEHEIKIERLESEVEELRNSNSEQSEMEMISLKKKIMDLEDSLRELQCSKGLQINNLLNASQLKDNEICHFKEENEELSRKLQTMMEEARKTKEELQTNIEELNEEIKKLNDKQQTEAKQFQEKTQRKDSAILKLEAEVEGKSVEIRDLKEERQKSSIEHHESIEKEKSQLITEYKEQLGSLKEEKLSLEESWRLQNKKIEQEIAQKDSDLKMAKMQIEQSKAIFQQKLQFLQDEIEQKDERVARITEENNSYIGMFEQKDEEISDLTNQIENFKMAHESSSEEFSLKFTEINDLVSQKGKELKIAERTNEKLQEQFQEITTKFEALRETHEEEKQTHAETIRQLRDKLQSEYSQSEQTKQKYEDEISALKADNQQNIEEQKRNVELSLIQLKNYYEMDKERLEKKILEDRKKHEFNESSVIQELEEKQRKVQKAHNETTNELNNNIEALEDQMNRMENEFEIRIATMEEDFENEKRILQSRCEIMEKKYHEMSEEYSTLEGQTNDDRIGFIKKIEMLNFEVGKKQKELLQANAKKQSADCMVQKKETQIENIKKLMNQEIENSLKKTQETNAKCQKINEEYLQYKMDSEKELALEKQRNQFLTARLAELSKEKEIGSSKNLEKADKQKILELKEQVERQKSELLVFESKVQTMKKTLREKENAYVKQISALEKDVEHQKQRVELEKVKNTDMDSKISQKNENFKRELESIKQKYQSERIESQKERQELKERNMNLEDEKNSISWQLQKEVALLNDKIQYAERQRDDARRELEDREKQIHILQNQLKKTSDKSTEDSESKKVSMDRRVTQQLETMKISMKARTDEQEGEIKSLKEEVKLLRQKNLDLTEKLQKQQRSKEMEKSLIKENESLLRSKEELETKHRSEKAREVEEWKRKLAESERQNKELMNQNNVITFQLEKNESKWNMEKNSLIEKVNGLQDEIEWLKNSSELQRNSSKSRLDSSKRSDLSRYTNYK